VVIFIPIMAALAKQMGVSVSKVMIPLSFASILGGMVTLIGSSTNLLVSGVLKDMGLPPLGFFEFSTPGMVLAGVGLVFVILVVPFYAF
jgi:di/tricarboxylate transporter